MNNKNLIIENNFQKKFLNKKLNYSFNKKIKKIFYEIDHQVNLENNLFSMFNKNFKFNFKFKELKRFKKFKTIAIIGMGGSILGANAISEYLSKKIKKEIYFFDNLDEYKNLLFKKNSKKKNILYLIVSKSGNTIETLSNFFSLNINKNKKNNIIIISESKNNILSTIAEKLKIHHIEHKNYIGGRFSVLSEVGVVPAYLMGLNIHKFRKNIENYLKDKSKEKNFLNESSTFLANILCQKKINDLIFLNYEPKLEKFIFWCQQLIAESLGKKGKGFLPVISNAPKDHHSLLQLYLDGPKNKIFTIFSKIKKDKIRIKTDTFTKKINFLNNKDLSSVKSAQKNSLIQILKKQNIPYREIKVKNDNEEALGELFSYFILETIIVAKLANINPFDQPAVERVKVLTKKLLK